MEKAFSKTTQFIYENRKIIKRNIISDTNFEFQNIVIQAISDSIYNIIQQNLTMKKKPDIPLFVITNFLTGGILYLVYLWVESDCSAKIYDVQSELVKLVNGVLKL